MNSRDDTLLKEAKKFLKRDGFYSFHIDIQRAMNIPVIDKIDLLRLDKILESIKTIRKQLKIGKLQEEIVLKILGNLAQLFLIAIKAPDDYGSMEKILDASKKLIEKLREPTVYKKSLWKWTFKSDYFVVRFVIFLIIWLGVLILTGYLLYKIDFFSYGDFKLYLAGIIPASLLLSFESAKYMKQ